MIVLDTNVVSEAMKPQPDHSVRDWLDAQAAETLFLTSITIAELKFGVGALPSGKRKERLKIAIDGHDLSRAMNVTVQYFFDGMATANPMPNAANDAEQMEGDILSQKETLELVRAYYRLGERPRKRLLELAKALEGDNTSTGAA